VLERIVSELGPSASGRRFDQLGQGQAGDEQLRHLLGRSPGRPQRLFVAAEAVGQDRVHKFGKLDRESVALGGGLADH
jgi:hypothetical protein